MSSVGIRHMPWYTIGLAPAFEPTFIFVEPKPQEQSKEIIVIVEYAQPGAGSAAPALAAAPAKPLGWPATIALLVGLFVGLGVWLSTLSKIPAPLPPAPPRRKRRTRKVQRRRS